MDWENSSRTIANIKCKEKKIKKEKEANHIGQ